MSAAAIERFIAVQQGKYKMRRAFEFRVIGRTRIRNESLESPLETHRRLYNECLDYRKLGYETLRSIDRICGLLSLVQSSERESNIYIAPPTWFRPRPSHDAAA